MEDSIQTWEARLDGVVKQEVERAREVTNWAKEALRHAGEDEEKRQEVERAREVTNWAKE